MGKKLTTEERQKRRLPSEEKTISYIPQDSFLFFIPPDDNGSVGTGKSRPRVVTKGGRTFSYYQEYYENFRNHADPYILRTINEYKAKGFHFPINLERANGEIVCDKKGLPLVLPTICRLKLCCTSKQLDGKKIAWIKQSSDSDNIFGAYMDLPSFANSHYDYREGGNIPERVLYDDDLRNIKSQSTRYISEATWKDAPLGYGAYISVVVLKPVILK